MNFFGVSAFAARFPNALLGVILLPLLYALGKNVSGRGNFGLLWTMCYCGSILPALSFKFGLPDPWCSVFMLLSVYALSGYYAPPTGKVHSMRRIALAGVGIGLALLSNGAVSVMLVVLTWLLFWILRRRSEPFPLTELAVYCALALALSLLWYGAELWRNGLWFFRDFVQYHLRHFVAGNPAEVQSFISMQPPVYHVLLLFIVCFPTLTLVLPAVTQFWQSRRLLNERNALSMFTLWMALLLGAVLLLYTIAGASTSHLHSLQANVMQYFSILYFPLTLFAALTIDGLLRGITHLSRWTSALMICIGVVLVGLLGMVPLVGMNKEWLLEQIKDNFIRGNLQANVSWSAWEMLPAGTFAVSVLAAAYFVMKKRYFEMVLTIFPATLLTVLCFTAIVTPKIEGYTQGAAVEFYQGLQGQPCYIRALGFTTYADLFYAQKQPSQSASALNIPPEEFELWLLEGDIDKPAYFVCKITDAAAWRKHHNLEELYEKNGFVFLKRETKKKLNLAWEN